jgi:hypothetical protein
VNPWLRITIKHYYWNDLAITAALLKGRNSKNNVDYLINNFFILRTKENYSGTYKNQ